jgi:LysM repeat protein
MSDERVVATLGEICPNLGIADDPAVRCLGASSFHRCHGDPRPRLIGTRYQIDFCLSGEYGKCSRWQPSESETSVVAGVGYLFGWDGRSLRRAAAEVVRHLGTAVMGLAWMALAVTAIVLLAPLLTAANPGARAGALPLRDVSANSARPQAAAVETPEAAASLAVQPTAGPAGPEAVNQIAPTSEVAAASAPAPDLTPSPEASAPRAEKPPSGPASQEQSYVVQSKDTLWSLARAHGVTVDDIMRANGLGNRDYIRTGQTIIIPVPEPNP